MATAMDQINFNGAGGLRLMADSCGAPEDPVVLLLPSAGQSRAFWHGAAQALAAAGRYAICLDLRGHGESGHAADGRYDIDAHAADVRAVLAALPRRAFIVAAGLGALAAIAAVGEGEPHLVSGLALVDVTIWFDVERAGHLQKSLASRTASFDDEAAIIETISAQNPDEPRPGATAPILAAFARGADGRWHWRGDARAITAAGSPGPREQLQARLGTAVTRLGTPVLLIRGARNETISAAATQRLQALIPNAETAEIAGAGHYAATDQEDAFNAVLLDFLERAAPRQPLTYSGGSDPRVLRDALGCFGTGVTIVTTIDETGAPVGLTANSFTSVSLEPPLILFSLARNSANLGIFTQAGRFAVNVLHIGQQPHAGRFARRDVARFDGIDWALRATGGSPILAGSLAAFDCSTFAVHDGGDHLVFIGRVNHAWFEPHRDPLLYFRGKYRRLHFT